MAVDMIFMRIQRMGKLHQSQDILQGVVRPQGMWPVTDENETDIAGSANMVTSTIPTEPSKGARTHSAFVEVAALT